ncbi:BZ3500_MvSof-1268-A1-R1_Chr10-1g02593 [Microbotryum saponariae]|uniref:BZ3500_MvSof-1268-A1-R1_Chr10-1g02593 protein n=1 Tax=Microbotryum saponariae TaxID=289078 RepID=A0A2X0NEQ8_9BASI|nr:BZ3500_MvSof-1268-A1-R1_Chr10-1g02593 [Microbotryum saponariae]SDA06082.1 BZ3501_MvSof-1269-A2-R1_Chr10-1g02194 [Microbotryum saponariae]
MLGRTMAAPFAFHNLVTVSLKLTSQGLSAVNSWLVELEPGKSRQYLERLNDPLELWLSAQGLFLAGRARTRQIT